MMKHLCIATELVEGDEGSYLPNCQSNLVIALHALSLLFCNFWQDVKGYLKERSTKNQLTFKSDNLQRRNVVLLDEVLLVDGLTRDHQLQIENIFLI